MIELKNTPLTPKCLPKKAEIKNDHIEHHKTNTYIFKLIPRKKNIGNIY